MKVSPGINSSIKEIKRKSSLMTPEEITSMLSESIPPEVMEVINFISDRETFYEKEVSDKVKKDVQEKFGESGIKVYDDLNKPTQDFDGEECPECKADEEEIIEEEEECAIPDFIMDQICESIIENSPDRKSIYCRDILSAVKRIYPEFLDFINKSDIEKICKLILSKGIEEGWLMDEMFDLEDIPKEIQERSVNGGELSKKELKLIEKEDK